MTAVAQAPGPAAAGPVLPSGDDPLVRATSTLIGGPVGAHARIGGRRFWTVWRVLVALTVLTCTLGWAQKVQCRDTRNWSHDDGTYQYTRLCYSDVVALYGVEGLAAGQVPYVDHPVEYPVLIGAAMEVGRSVASLPGRGTEGYDAGAATFYDATVLLLAAGALVTVICTGMTAGRRRIWDAAMVALAPALVLHLGTNWDMIAVALASGGLLAWARSRPVLAGMLLGLGTAAKFYPLLFCVPIGLLCLRSARLRAFATTTGAAVATVAVLYAAVWPFTPAFASDGALDKVGPSAWQALTGPGGSLAAAARALAPRHDGGSNGLLRFFELNRTRPADFDSVWYALQRATGSRFGTGVLTLGVGGGLLLVLGAVAALALLAPRRPRLPQLLFLLLTGFLLVNKVFSPQYTLWLLPLAVLARPRWRLFLVWQASEVLLVVVRYAMFINMLPGKSDKGAPYPWFLGTVLLRDGLLLALCGLVVRDVLRPDRDPVRADGRTDDPAGGVLDRSPDRPGLAGSTSPAVALA